MTSTHEPRPGRPRTGGSTSREPGSAARSAAALRAQRAARASAGSDGSGSARAATPVPNRGTSGRRPGVASARTGRPGTRTAVRPPAARPPRRGAAPRPTGPRRGRIVGVDGLRAVAVALVLVYHLLPGAMPGGMVGVDAFFVISGFLITTLLVDERRRTGRTDLKRFWSRRLRRIVPALLLAVVVVVSLAAALGGDVLLGVRRQVLGAAALVYNWVEIAAGSSYFDQAQPLLLTNVWSLAVEEQFYVVWPLVLILLLAGRTDHRATRRAAVGALVLSVASFVWAGVLAAHGASSSRTYMGTDAHAFGLMLGAALALWHGRALDPELPAAPPRARSLRGALGWVGLAGLLVVGRVADDGARGAGPFQTTCWLALASVLTALILQSLTREVAEAPGPAAILPRILEAKPLGWLGTRSYGLYLWHWPLWVLAFYAAPAATSPGAVAGSVTVVSVVVAELSYRFIETPIRRDGVAAWLRSARGMTSRGLVSLSAAVTVVVMLVALAFAAQPRESSAQQAIEAGALALATPSAQPSATASASGTPSAPPSATPAPSATASPGASATPTATPAPSQAPADGAAVPGDQVEVIGDSVALASAPSMEALFPGVGVDAKVSRNYTAALQTLAAADAAYGARTYVVVGLATNAGVSEDQLNALLAAIGEDRDLILVTGYGPARTTWIPGANDEIRSFAAEHPDRVAVAAWDEAIKGHEDLLAQDQVHPGPEGGAIYAQAVNQAIASLAKH